MALTDNQIGLGSIYTSTNSGTSWTSNNTSSLGWQAVASSADGVKLAATVVNPYGGIYTSTNSGITWISNNVPVQQWRCIASSADGTILAAGISSIYTSTNFGVSWTSNSAPQELWYCVASSADGGMLLAAALDDRSFNLGLVYASQSIPTPSLAISPSSYNFNLSWTVPSTNFVLQQSPDLISWSSVTNSPTLNLTNLNNELSLSPTNSSGFFRLMSQ